MSRAALQAGGEPPAVRVAGQVAGTEKWGDRKQHTDANRSAPWNWSRAGARTARASRPARKRHPATRSSRPFQPLDTAKQADTRMEEAQIHRLDHIIIGSGLETGDLVLDAGTVGNNHDRQVVSLGQPPYLFTEAQAVAFRQIHLSNEQIRGIGAHGIKRLARAAHETHVVRVAK